MPSHIHRQVTLANMQGYVRFCIPDSACDTIQIWKRDGTETYALGSEGLVMLAQAGIFPRKETINAVDTPFRRYRTRRSRLLTADHR